MKTVIATFYINIDGVEPSKAGDYIAKVRKECDLVDAFDKETVKYVSLWIPTRNSPTKVEFTQF